MSRTMLANGKANYSMSLNSTWSRDSLAHCLCLLHKLWDALVVELFQFRSST